MARIIYTALVESIRGSIAGTTFQRNRHGYTIKKKPNMVNPNTALQNSRKVIFSSVVRSWRDLTSGQRSNYETYASTYPQYAKNNPTSQLSGYEVFVRYNCLRRLTGYSVLTSWAGTVPADDDITVTITNDSGVLKINITVSTETEDWKVLFFLSRPFSPTQNFIGTAPKYVGFLTNVVNSYTATDAYTSLYGSLPAVGDLVALDILFISDVSPYVLSRDSAVITVTTTP